MRRLLSFLLVLTVLVSVSFIYKESIRAEGFSAPETPAPARIHETPAPTEEPPVILNRTQTPDPLESFRFRLDAKMLHVWFPNIMNCDEVVLMYDDNVWLIDCCSEKLAPRGVEMMQRLGIPKIEKLFNTHPHYDHIEGLRVTYESVPVDELLYGANFPADANDTMVAALAYAEEALIPVRTFQDGETFCMGDGEVTLTFYYNDYDGEPRNMNDCSAIALLEYGNRRMLFMADMERNFGQSSFYPRLAAGLDLHADVIKYPHHGNNGMLNEFWMAVNPTIAVVTNSRGVQKAGIDFLMSKRAGIFYTNYPEKYVHLYTDGYSWVVEYVPVGDVTPVY